MKSKILPTPFPECIANNIPNCVIYKFKIDRKNRILVEFLKLCS